MSARIKGIGWKTCGLASVFASAFLLHADMETPDPKKIEEEEIARVREFLSQTYPKKGYDHGPSRIRSAEVETAYPGLRFYRVVSSTEPVAVRELNMVLCVNDMEIRVVTGGRSGFDSPKPDDFNQGLKMVRTEAEARTAAAAIMTLCIDRGRVPPAVSKDAVAVSGTKDDGWKCSFSKKREWVFEVQFDKEGKCIKADARYEGPRAICFGGLFNELDAGDRARLGLSGGGAVCVEMGKGSVGEQAGMRVGDCIVGLDGEAVPVEDPIAWLRERVIPLKEKGGTSATVEILRGGRRIQLLARWPER